MIKKRINIDLIAFTSTASVGTFVFLKRLFSEIAKLEKLDFLFVFYVQRDFDINRITMPKGSRIVRVPIIKSPILRVLYEQTFFLNKLGKADYLFSPCFSLPFFTRSNKILTIHDLIPFILPGKYGKSKCFFIKIIYILSAFFADTIVTVSENSKKDLIRILGIPEHKIKVVYNFVSPDDPVALPGENLSLFKEFGIEKPYFINVSTLQPGKNVEILVRSFGKFCQTNDNYQLCIVGNKGWAFNSIFEEVKKYRLEKKVIFTGYLTDSQLASMYEASFGVAYVSLYEGFGIPPLEGFYHGKAVLSSCNSSLPEVIGKAGVYVDPTNEISIVQGFMKFIEQKSNLETHIPSQIALFNPRKITESFLDIFK